MLYEAFIRFVCDKTYIDILIMTSLSTPCETTIILKCPDKIKIDIQGIGISPEESEKNAWKTCFRDKHFRYYMELLKITGDLDNMNLYNLD